MSEMWLSGGFLVAFTVVMLVADHQRAKRWNAIVEDVDRALVQMAKVAERRRLWVERKMEDR